MNMTETLRKKRDIKAMPHLEQYAPVWITDEQVFEIDEALQFDVLFQHHVHGWINRRYRYDGFNNVLYHKGQTLVAEDDALNKIGSSPYISAQVADTPNAYGG